jgi:hypothetical protein
VRRLLSISDALERIRPLVAEDTLHRHDARRKLVQELERLTEMLIADF